MTKIGLFYGSSTGNTQAAAQEIADAFGEDVVDIHNIAEADAKLIEHYGSLIFGVSTWGLGEMQEDWEAFSRRMNHLHLTGRKVALFGLGDQKTYPDTFVNALGTLYDKVRLQGGDVVGFWPIDGYEFTASTAEEYGKFVGLVLDQENQAELTSKRIAQWVQQIKPELR